jgi:signal transduction histidine kinase
MERLINDLLEVKRFEAGHVALDRGTPRVGSIVAQAQELFSGLAVEKGLDFDVRVDASADAVHADRERTLQVLSNLLGNAIKFTTTPGRVTLTAARRDNHVVFRVEDTGIGIPPEDLPHIFDRFWQADRNGRQGIGLGLAIARAIVHAHGGSIGAESQPGSGATFSFTLPVAPVDEPDST